MGGSRLSAETVQTDLLAAAAEELQPPDSDPLLAVVKRKWGEEA